LLSYHTWNKKRYRINKELSMIIKINYNKSTKQIVVSNDIKQIILSVTDSTIIDTDDELSFEIAGNMTEYQEMFELNIEDEME